MQLNLSPATMDWLNSKVRSGQFASFEEAIDYSVKLASLRETLQSSIDDPARLTTSEVRDQLRVHFEERRAARSGTP